MRFGAYSLLSETVAAAMGGRWQKQWTDVGWWANGGRMADGGAMAEDRDATYGRKGRRIVMFVAREAVEVLPEKRAKVLPEKWHKKLPGKLSDGPSAK